MVRGRVDRTLERAQLGVGRTVQQGQGIAQRAGAERRRVLVSTTYFLVHISFQIHLSHGLCDLIMRTLFMIPILFCNIFEHHYSVIKSL